VVDDIKKCRKTDNFKSPLSYILRPPFTFEHQGGFAITQALYFLVSHKMVVPPTLLAENPEYLWNSELANKLIDFVIVNDRPDLVPLIQRRIKKPLTPEQ
jgi:hypothetical protein